MSGRSLSPSRRALVVFGILGTLTASAACTSARDDGNEDGVSEDQLKTEDHRAITTEYCIRAGFHDAFCARVAAEAFVVDREEWEHPWAHAMPQPGQSSCDAAAAVQKALVDRGNEIRRTLARPTLGRDEIETLAKALGRALHALQDNCAHQGMTNPQHSWYSIRGFCDGTGEDPDTAPSALECGANETKLVFRTMKEAFRAARHDPASLWQAHDMAAPQPSLAHVCEFLGEWRGFDGKDARWELSVTAPAFRETLTKAILQGVDSPRVCDGLAAPASGASPIAARTPRPQVRELADPTCTRIRLLCGT